MKQYDLCGGLSFEKSLYKVGRNKPSLKDDPTIRNECVYISD